MGVAAGEGVGVEDSGSVITILYPIFLSSSQVIFEQDAAIFSYDPGIR